MSKLIQELEHLSAMGFLSIATSELWGWKVEVIVKGYSHGSQMYASLKLEGADLEVVIHSAYKKAKEITREWVGKRD